VGSDSFVFSKTSEFFKNATGHVDRVAKVARDAVKIKTKAHAQRLYKLTRWCLAPAAVGYHLRVMDPKNTTADYNAGLYDEAVYSLLLDILSIDPNDPVREPNSPEGIRARAHARLAAASGGLGITAAKDVATDFYLGSVALTAKLVMRVVGKDSNDDSIEAAKAMPYLETAINDADIKNLNIPLLQNRTAEDIADQPIEGLTHALLKARKPGQLKAVLDAAASPQHKAWTLSCGAEGANWLMADPRTRGLSPLTAAQFTTLARTRLGLAPTSDSIISGTCPHCNKLTDTAGLHPLHCQAKGKGNATGQRTTRHANVKDAIIHALRRTTGDRGRCVINEPVLRDLWQERTGYIYNERDGKDPRGDISVQRANNIIVADLCITHPNTSRAPMADAANEPLVAANRSYDLKQNKYHSRFAIPAGQFVPLIAETGGRLHPVARTFISDYIKDIIGKDRDAWSKDDLNFYNTHLRDILESLSIALAKSVATTLMLPGSVGLDAGDESGSDGGDDRHAPTQPTV